MFCIITAFYVELKVYALQEMQFKIIYFLNSVLRKRFAEVPIFKRFIIPNFACQNEGCEN